MTDETKVPERKLRHEGPHRDDAAGLPLPIDHGSIGADASIDNPAWRRPLDRPWPFQASDVPPLHWWRTLPSYAFRDAEQTDLQR